MSLPTKLVGRDNKNYADVEQTYDEKYNGLVVPELLDGQRARQQAK